MHPVSAPANPVIAMGDRVFAGTYTLHSAFERVRNFVCGENLVSIVAPEVGCSGHNVLWNVLQEELPHERSIAICEHEIVVGNNHFSTLQAQKFDSGWSTAPCKRWPAEIAQSLSGMLVNSQFGFFLKNESDFSGLSGFNLSVVIAAQKAQQLFALGSTVDAVRSLRGLGLGLTPAGDDFLAGMLASYSVLEKMDGVFRTDKKKMILEHALGGNALSNAFLRAAAVGSFSYRQQVFFEACVNGTQAEQARAAQDIVAIGASSGADFAVGFLYTMERECAA